MLGHNIGDPCYGQEHHYETLSTSEFVGNATLRRSGKKTGQLVSSSSHSKTSMFISETRFDVTTQVRCSLLDPLSQKSPSQP